ncbi:OmpA family protein [Mucilaginibacter ginsenosidivorax]|uniref:OmpA family protein n=1 Tax=Mucilaginibacter ginsenosidivorax TaxID=862126 RepID=A0A5B8VYM9_9SPHI|nr:OmpA family protein [Mucilaginibacter ginsenosidivorax]QEC75566.1 OmpA family protein [Mucilaginibacter ginsenosidivorax]
MNYSTLKKSVALSFASLMVVGMANAQTDSTKTATTTTTEASTAKVFGGIGQYNTFSIGVSAGITDGLVPFTINTTNKFKADLGYGLYLRQQLSHTFSLQLDYLGGKVHGIDDAGTSKFGITEYKTNFNSVALSGVFNIASVSFLHRKNSVNFYGSAGLGLDLYKPKMYVTDAGATVNDPYGSGHTVKELYAPVGAGVKFRLSDALALNLGYTVSFVQGYNFAGKSTYPTFSHYSYTYGGLEYTFGPKSKQNLTWVNPVAQMYDELYDAALRQEVEALKGRVTNVETAVSDLKKDSDGDGVADQFDKCPGTAAGSVVDGSGCVIVFPKPDSSALAAKAPATAYSNIQFEFDSSVLRTSSYPVLDATSADLRASGAKIEVDGFASSEGTAAHNMSLSKDRANSVKTYLVNSGVDAKKVKIKGYGETKPIADNSTEEGRVLNRRVQFKK